MAQNTNIHPINHQIEGFWQDARLNGSYLANKKSLKVHFFVLN
jgi:hypothetical protein